MAFISYLLLLRIARCFSIACLALLGACSGAPPQIAPKAPTIWPRPPDQPRFVYETMLQSRANLYVSVSAKDKMFEGITGLPTVSDRPVLEKPSAVVARNGNVYVADAAKKSIIVFDVPRRKIYRFGLRQPGTLAQPSGLALDAQMQVYVADAKRREVLVYDELGLFQRAIGDPDDLDRPVGVAVSRDGERIYVIDRSTNDTDRHRVVVYDKEGKKLSVIGTRGSGEGQFNVPLQAAVAADGTLYVLDSGNFRVQAFDREGRFLRAFGGAGVNAGNFARPRGIAVDDEGRIYVTDASFNNFQIFTPDGQLLLAVGRGGAESAPGQYGLLSGIAVDETGRVYVVDQLFNKVEVIRPLSDAEGKQMLAAAQSPG